MEKEMKKLCLNVNDKLKEMERLLKIRKDEKKWKWKRRKKLKKSLKK